MSDSPPTTYEPVPDLPASSNPVRQQERIASIDALRGLALLGILVLNIKAFSMIAPAYFNPTAYGDLTGANYWVWYFSHILGDMKFMGIFSMLFGAGIVLMTDRAIAKTGRAAGVHYRRMAWLLLIGLFHAHVIWYGDILVLYAECGLLLYPLRRLPSWALFALGSLLLIIGSMVAMGMGLSIEFWDERTKTEMIASWAPTSEQVAEQLSIYTSGWLTQMPDRSMNAAFFETMGFFIFGLWRAGGLMLMGMGLFKMGAFSAQWSSKAYGLIAAASFVIGLPICHYGVVFCEGHAWAFEYCFFQGQFFNYWGSVFVSLGYVSVVMLMCKAGMRFITGPLAAVGQMALTNYLMHSVICTLIFYGHGLGQFGQWDRTQQIGLVFAIWILQLVLSPIWLKAFRFGPAEWAWRSLTYWSPQPMRRPPDRSGDSGVDGLDR